MNASAHRVVGVFHPAIDLFHPIGFPRSFGTQLEVFKSSSCPSQSLVFRKTRSDKQDGTRVLIGRHEFFQKRGSGVALG